MSDIELEKHAKEYHNLTLNQFKLMCNESDKRFEGQFSSIVDKRLAVESFCAGFKVAISNAPSWQGNKEFVGLSDDEIGNAFHLSISKEKYETGLSVGLFARAVEQALKEKNT